MKHTAHILQRAIRAADTAAAAMRRRPTWATIRRCHKAIEQLARTRTTHARRQKKRSILAAIAEALDPEAGRSRQRSRTA